MSERIESATELNQLPARTVVLSISDSMAWQCMGGPVKFWTNGLWPATSRAASELIRLHGAVVVLWTPPAGDPR